MVRERKSEKERGRDTNRGGGERRGEGGKEAVLARSLPF